MQILIPCSSKDRKNKNIDKIYFLANYRESNNSKKSRNRIKSKGKINSIKKSNSFKVNCSNSRKKEVTSNFNFQRIIELKCSMLEILI